VLADIARLTIEDRMLIRLKLNMAAYGEKARMRDNFEFVALPPRPNLVQADDFGKHMTGYIKAGIYAEAPGS
jgi:hypothetical protein